MLKLEPLLRFTNGVTAQAIGRTPFGERTTYIVGEGVFTGAKLRGRILAGGGDWFVRGTGDLARLDVRKTFETDDGALIHVTYVGLYKFDAGVTRSLAAGGDAQFGDTLFIAQVQFETGDARYAWLNETLAVAEARETGSGVEYQLYALAHERAGAGAGAGAGVGAGEGVDASLGAGGK
jgi:hypothetical protein